MPNTFSKPIVVILADKLDYSNISRRLNKLDIKGDDDAGKFRLHNAYLLIAFN